MHCGLGAASDPASLSTGAGPHANVAAPPRFTHVRAHAAAALSHTPDGAVPDICGKDWPFLQVQAHPSRSTGQPVGPPSGPAPPLEDEEAEVDGVLEPHATTVVTRRAVHAHSSVREDGKKTSARARVMFDTAGSD